MNFPRHKGFSQELSHETTAAPVPNWLTIDTGCWTPPVRFARINDAILWLFDGIAMTTSGKVINESAFTLLERSSDLTAMTGTQRRRLRRVFDRRTLQDAEVIDDPVLIPTNGWNRAFGHWIYDTLTAINTFIEPIRSGRQRVEMPEATAWQRSWLDLLGVTEKAIIEAGYEYVKARHAIVPSSLSIQNVRYAGPHSVALIDGHRPLGQCHGPACPYLYLSRLGRGEASHRTLSSNTLIEHGEREEPRGRTGADRLCRRNGGGADTGGAGRTLCPSRVILGPVGSALALRGLAAPGTSIVTMLPPPAAHSWINRSLANLDHLYGCIMAEVIEDSQRDLKRGCMKRAGWFYN